MSNFTKELVATLTATASAQENGKITNEVVKELEKREEFRKAGLTASAIRGKAVSEGIYQKAEKTSGGTSGNATKSKTEIVAAIEILMSAPKGSMDSFIKASKPELQAHFDRLVSLSDQQNADNAE